MYPRCCYDYMLSISAGRARARTNFRVSASSRSVLSALRVRTPAEPTDVVRANYRREGGAAVSWRFRPQIYAFCSAVRSWRKFLIKVLPVPLNLPLWQSELRLRRCAQKSHDAVLGTHTKEASHIGIDLDETSRYVEMT